MGTREVVAQRVQSFVGRVNAVWLSDLMSQRLIDEYVATRRLAQGKKPASTMADSTIRGELTSVLAMLRTAKRWRMVAGEVPEIPRQLGPKSATVKPPCMTEDQFAALKVTLREKPWTVCYPDRESHAGLSCDPADWWAGLLAFLFCTGCRITAALSLRWTDTDLDRGLAMIRAEDAKSGRDQHMGLGDAAPFLARIRGFSDRVFPWARGRSTLYAQFRAVQDAAGVRPPACRGNHEHTPACSFFEFHALRRGHVTTARDHGIPIELIQDQVGHAALAMTRHYDAKEHARAYQFPSPPSVRDWASDLRRNAETPAKMA